MNYTLSAFVLFKKLWEKTYQFYGNVGTCYIKGKDTVNNFKSELLYCFIKLKLTWVTVLYFMILYVVTVCL